MTADLSREENSSAHRIPASLSKSSNAVWSARHLVGEEPFAVLLPDDLLVGTPGCLAQMMEAYHRVGGGAIVAAEERPLEDVKRYGVIAPGAVDGNIVEVKGLVEKPKPAKAPSRLCIIGRYILQPELFAELDGKETGAGGEIQVTDAMARLIGRMPFHAVKTTCDRYDCGDKGRLPSRQHRGGADAAGYRARAESILKSVQTE